MLGKEAFTTVDGHVRFRLEANEARKGTWTNAESSWAFESGSTVIKTPTTLVGWVNTSSTVRVKSTAI